MTDRKILRNKTTWKYVSREGSFEDVIIKKNKKFMNRQIRRLEKHEIKKVYA